VSVLALRGCQLEAPDADQTPAKRNGKDRNTGSVTARSCNLALQLA
jgi:hypothetical protein